MITKTQWIVNFDLIEKALIDPSGISKEKLLEQKKLESKAILDSVTERGGKTFAIQLETDAPALSYQTHFWNFWNIVRELRDTYGIGHTSRDRVYE